MPTLYMMIGIPLSGKSTWINNSGIKSNNTVVLSTDNTIEAIAKASGKTYNDVFKDNIKLAETQLKKDRERAITEGRDIIWDQTNLSKKSRAGKLTTVPGAYRKVAVVFPHPSSDVLVARNQARSKLGKHIPDNVLSSMMKTYEEPSHDEGFESIIHVEAY